MLPKTKKNSKFIDITSPHETKSGKQYRIRIGCGNFLSLCMTRRNWIVLAQQLLPQLLNEQKKKFFFFVSLFLSLFAARIVLLEYKRHQISKNDLCVTYVGKFCLEKQSKLHHKPWHQSLAPTVARRYICSFSAFYSRDRFGRFVPFRSFSKQFSITTPYRHTHTHMAHLNRCVCLP